MKEETKTERKIAAIYARTSKEDKNDKKVSIEQQIEDGKNLAAKNGFTVTDDMIFIDRDLSGKLYPSCWLEKKGKSRPSFSRLIEAIEAGKVQGLVIRSRDRIARNTILSLRFYELMNQKKIDLFATGEAIFAANDASGRFALTVVIAAYQMQLEKIQSDCKASFDYRKRNRLNLCGTKTLGYKNKESTIIIDEVEAKLVNDIFDMYLAGKSINDISRYLNQNYLHLRTGIAKVYHHTTVSGILKNPNYVNNGVQPYPVIMEKEKWLAVQSSWKSRVNIKQCETKKQHLISGFLLCHYCGKPMTAYARNGETEYKCRHGSHKNLGFARNVEEKFYTEFLDNVIATAKIITLKAESKEAVEMEFKRDRIEKNISDLKAKFAIGEIDLGLFQELKTGIEKELAKIDKAIRDIDAETALRKSDVKQWVDMSFVEKRERIEAVVDFMRVTNSGLLLKLKRNVEAEKVDIPDIENADEYNTHFFPFVKRHIKSDKRNRAYSKRVIIPENYKDSFQIWIGQIVEGIKVRIPCYYDKETRKLIKVA